MRAAIITLGGLVGSGAILAIGLALDGLPGATLVLLGIMGATLTMGWSIALLTGIGPGPRLRRTGRRTDKPIRVRGTRTGRTVARSVRNPHRCGQCRSRRELRGHVWVCPRCDVGVAQRRHHSREDRPEVS